MKQTIIVLALLCTSLLPAMAQNDVEDVIAIKNVPLLIKFVARDSEMLDNNVVAVHGLYVTRFEITQKQWLSLMSCNNSTVKGDQLPVTNITADSAEAFCRKLDRLLAFGVRLLTEEEWQYIACGGLYPEHYRYCGSNNADFVTWHKANSHKRPHKGGERVSNELGIYDLGGNVGEMVTCGEKCYKVAGGNYMSSANECTPKSLKPYNGPNETTGLRVCWPITMYY
ncbi:MAG: SUMF1/EgtB/PvdO family nonheme iron enzyme [Bacteroidales bacterium]|nr:SUMF1/EgtB/PvdO family nonheme iron enzyme [Bacteroidales bacterium]